MHAAASVLHVLADSDTHDQTWNASISENLESTNRDIFE